MKIDVQRRSFVLANRTGGLSGPAIHPIAVRMVWQCAQAVLVPLIGMGGVQDIESALELMLAGASGVAVGTATFAHPDTAVHIVEGLEEYVREQNLTSITEIIGAVR